VRSCQINVVYFAVPNSVDHDNGVLSLPLARYHPCLLSDSIFQSILVRGAPCLVQACASLLLQVNAERCALCLAALQIGGTRDSAQRAANPYCGDNRESKKAQDKTEDPYSRAVLRRFIPKGICTHGMWSISRVCSLKRITKLSYHHSEIFFLSF